MFYEFTRNRKSKVRAVNAKQWLKWYLTAGRESLLLEYLISHTLKYINLILTQHNKLTKTMHSKSYQET